MSLAAPHVAALVLAAGQSSRFGADKRRAELASSEEISGSDSATSARTVLQRSIATLRATAIKEIIVALKPSDRDSVGDLLGSHLDDPAVRLCFSEQSASGLSGSIRDGLNCLRELPQSIDGLLIALGDMPFVQPSTISALLNHWSADKIIRPVCEVEDERREVRLCSGNPILFGRHWFDALQTCEGDAGARHLILEHPQSLVQVRVDDLGITRDIDRPKDLASGS